MSCFALPDSICSQIEGMVGKFYWSGDVSRRSIHWLGWKKLCRSKSVGGLGFRDFKAFNMALNGKNWWRFLTLSQSLLSRVFKVAYFSNGGLCGAKNGVIIGAMLGLASFGQLGCL